MTALRGANRFRLTGIAGVSPALSEAKTAPTVARILRGTNPLFGIARTNADDLIEQRVVFSKYWAMLGRFRFAQCGRDARDPSKQRSGTLK